MRFVALTVATLCAVGTVWAQPVISNSGDVPGLLYRAIHSAKRAHYSGRKTVEFIHNGKAISHDEIVYRDGLKTRIEFPQGSKFSGQIIVEDEKGRKHYFPDRNEVLVLPPRREESLDRLIRLVKRAQDKKVGLSSSQGQRVAGLLTNQIVVTDGAGNITQRIYIEPKSGIVLKRELFEAGGSRWGSFEFSQIDLDPPPFDGSLFQFERRGVHVVTPRDELKKLVAGKEFSPVWLPPSTGFLLEESHLDKIESTPALIESYVKKGDYQGTAKISVFELVGAVDPEQFRKFNRDEYHAASVQKEGKTFVVVGSLDEDSLKQLLQNLN